MTCYQRHLVGMFDTLGLAYDKKNRARVDGAIRKLFGLDDEAHCPEVWASIKALTPEESADLPARVADLL